MWKNIMFLNLFLCALVVIVISANNIIPVQTYPIYEQNGYTNPCLNQASNIQTYIYGANAQNQLNVSPTSIRENLLNNIYTNPSGQTALDPGITNYCAYLNGVENYRIPVNIVNKYPATSGLYLINNNTSNVNTDEKYEGLENGQSSKKRRRKSKIKRKHKYDDLEKNQINSFNDSVTKVNEFSTNDRKGLSKHTSADSSQTLDKIEDVNIKKDTKLKRKKKKEKDIIEENVTEEGNDVEITKQGKRRKKRKKHIMKSKSETDTITELQPMEFQNDLDIVLTKEGTEKERRQIRNSNQQSYDLLKSIPITPIEITKQYLNNFYKYTNSPMTNWFEDYKNFYKSLLANQPIEKTNEKRHKRKRKFRKPKKWHKTKSTISKNIIEATTVVNDNKTMVNSTTTEKIIYLSKWTEISPNSDPQEESTKLFEDDKNDTKYSSDEILRDGYSMNGYEEKYEDGYYAGYIDDYYPQFFDSALYNANNKEVILKNLNDDQYYYASDPMDMDFENNLDKQNQELISLDRLRDCNEIKHACDEIGTLSKENSDNTEDINFRSPPLLESPDFRTRQIDKSEIRPDVYFYKPEDSSERFKADKSSTYSKTKFSNFIGSKYNDIKDQQKNIETLYAKSKVASYGSVTIPDTSSTASINDSHQNDGTTYVIADSLDSPELYW